MPKYHDEFPLNAIVKIDYKTNKASFDYPNGNQNLKQRKKAVWLSIFPSWIMLFFIFLVVKLAIPLILTGQTYDRIGNPLVPVITVSLNDILVAFKEWSMIILIFCVPIIITDFVALNYKYFGTIFPKWNYFLMHTILRQKTKIVRLSSLDSKLFTVPVFGNVMMKYKAEGDFSEFLDNVEILPVDYKYWDGKKEKNEEYLWKANFHFSEIPKTGSLFIEYL